MQITFYGAAQQVTGSSYLLEVNGRRLLLECGLYQGKRDEAYEVNRHFEFDPRSVDAVILSHAHIDHCGNLPNLVKQGYAGPIYATTATAQLADVMLRDSGHIQESDAEYMNRKRLRRGQPSLPPIYTQADAALVASQFRPVEYNQGFEPVAGVQARMLEAGHILGSAAVQLDVSEPGGRKLRFWYSGDIGQRKLPLLRDPVLPSGVNYLVMECTYGDTPREHDVEQAYHHFAEVVKRTIERGGKVIIPAFSVGRTQELVYALNQLIQSGELPPVPVYVDSPLAVEASKVFFRNEKYFDKETQQFIREEDTQALRFDSLTYITDVADSKALNNREDPMVIISASGMAEVGRILHHIKNNVEDPKNTILIVSWQAPYTLGRRLKEGAREIEIFGEIYPVRARVESVEGLSAHAGQEMLVEYALAARDTTELIMLVHGEPDAAQALEERIRAKGGPRTLYPTLEQTLEL